MREGYKWPPGTKRAGDLYLIEQVRAVQDDVISMGTDAVAIPRSCGDARDVSETGAGVF